MLKIIKSIVPMSVRQALYPLKDKTYNQWQKKKLFNQMQLKHARLIEQIKGKQKVKVLFLSFNASKWKVDPVFKKMLADPLFEPEILVCPYISLTEELMLEDMEQAYNYFRDKRYSVQKSRKDDGSWVTIDELKPDILFFTEPHRITRSEYYEDAYLNYLSCYVPYFFLITTHGNDQSIYNFDLHNAMWKIFLPHAFSMQQARRISASKAGNCLLTGYPACEDLIRVNSLSQKEAWKPQSKMKKKIIFAPHHTIFESELMLSNFLQISELMVALAEKYQDEIQWSFKPHPVLKSRLYKHSDWGKHKTDKYYEWWQSQDYTQLDIGEYVDLFLQSDGIIHDCGSFITEYLFINKPCAYLQLNGKHQLESINDFGKYCLSFYDIIYSSNDLIEFIENVVSLPENHIENHEGFQRDYVNEFYNNGKLPSDAIIQHIKESITMGNIN